MNVFRRILDGNDAVLGRKDVLETLKRHLHKPTPDHVSVIGPRGYGKSPVLRATCRMLDSEQRFLSVVCWDIRHDGDHSTDGPFLDGLWCRIGTALKSRVPELSGEIFDEPGQEMLRTTFDYLDAQGQHVLVFLDGLDRLLLASSITRNLWDFLRSLAERRSLTLVTATRRRLRELCANPDSRTSDFWNIFYETPLVLGTYGERDWMDVFDELRIEGFEADHEARADIMRWTGGIPRLVLYLCDRLVAGRERRLIESGMVTEAAERVLIECRDAIADIWDGCSARQQTLLLDLEEKGTIRRDRMAGTDLNDLSVKGLIHGSGDVIEPGARLVGRFARQHGEEIVVLRDVLGTPDKYRENMFSLIQLRLDSAAGIDPDLRRELELVINMVKEHPARAADLLRNVAGVALDKILEAELPISGLIPRDWMEEWQATFQSHFLPSQNPPRTRDQKKKTIRAIVDERTSCPSRISFSTYLLLDQIYSVGNFGNHVDEMGGEDVPFLFMAQVFLQAIYLAERLSVELSPSRPD